MVLWKTFFSQAVMLHVQNYSYAIIWLLSLILLVGLSSCGTVMPLSYITPPPLLSLSSPFLLFASVCLCWWCVKTVQPASPAPLAAVRRSISALSSLCKDTKLFERIRNSALFWFCPAYKYSATTESAASQLEKQHFKVSASFHRHISSGVGNIHAAFTVLPQDRVGKSGWLWVMYCWYLSYGQFKCDSSSNTLRFLLFFLFMWFHTSPPLSLLSTTALGNTPSAEVHGLYCGEQRLPLCSLHKLNPAQPTSHYQVTSHAALSSVFT